MNARRRILVRGRVQGVGYRVFVADTAGRFGLAGWVRNRRDGTVEALLEGPADAVLAAISVCRTGPPGARVEALDESEPGPSVPGVSSDSRFAILATV